MVLTKCIELAPDDYKAYGLRGYNHYELFELEKAIADYTKAIEIEPDDVISYNNRGLAHEKNGEYELSLEDYTKAVELEPNEVSGYYNRGNIYLKLAEYEKAIAEYNKALEMSDDEWLTSCIKMNQETAEKLLLKGERKVWGRTPVNIRIYFDKVIAMDSNYVEAYLNRGLAIVKWGNSGIYVANYKKAIADFDKVLELEPDNEQARKYREFCCEQLSKKEEDEIDD